MSETACCFSTSDKNYRPFKKIFTGPKAWNLYRETSRLYVGECSSECNFCIAIFEIWGHPLSWSRITPFWKCHGRFVLIHVVKSLHHSAVLFSSAEKSWSLKSICNESKYSKNRVNITFPSDDWLLNFVGWGDKGWNYCIVGAFDSGS